MIDAGVEAYLTCVDPKALPPEFVGRRFDETLLGELPELKGYEVFAQLEDSPPGHTDYYLKKRIELNP